MANSRKVIDRNSKIPAAGKVFKSVENVGESLKFYSREEAAFNIMKSKIKKQEMQDNKSLGYSQFLPTESLKDLLSPELEKSRFIAFKEKFSEDMYYKKAELGKVLTLQSKPQEISNENFTYGLKNKKSERAYDLIYPNNREFSNWHDKYLISHKHYLPAERINRHYNANFKPHATYGIFNNVDQTGHSVRKCLQHFDRMVVINKTQKEFLDRTTAQIGKQIYRYSLNMDPNQTFGIQAKEKFNFNVRTLIENIIPCPQKIEIIEAISHINKLRRLIFNRSDLRMYDLKIMLNKHKENEAGFITLKSIMRVLHSLQIRANEQKLRSAISYFEMLKYENESTEIVNIEEFWKTLHIQYPLPRKMNLSDRSKEYESVQTTYSLLCSDREKPVIQKLRHKSYENRTTSDNPIAPDIPMQYGLNPTDFKVLRSKEELKRIFKHVLPQNFDQVWKFAWKESYDEASSKMSVTEFRNVIKDFDNRVAE